MPRPRKIDDPTTRTKLLVALAQGKTRTQACLEAGIDTRTLRNCEKADPEFAEQVHDAEEAAYDPVELRIREMATAGDLGAAKEYRTLKRRREVRESRERKLEIDNRVTHVVEVEENLRKLISTLKERQQLEQVTMKRE